MERGNLGDRPLPPPVSARANRVTTHRERRILGSSNKFAQHVTVKDIDEQLQHSLRLRREKDAENQREESTPTPRPRECEDIPKLNPYGTFTSFASIGESAKKNYEAPPYKPPDFSIKKTVEGAADLVGTCHAKPPTSARTGGSATPRSSAPSQGAGTLFWKSVETRPPTVQPCRFRTLKELKQKRREEFLTELGLPLDYIRRNELTNDNLGQRKNTSVKTRAELLEERKKAMLPPVQYDVDGDGYVDPKELYIGRVIDSNNDGNLSEDELAAAKDKIKDVNENVEFGYDAAGPQHVMGGGRVIQKNGVVIENEDFTVMNKKGGSRPVRPSVKSLVEGQFQVENEREKSRSKLLRERKDKETAYASEQMRKRDKQHKFVDLTKPYLAQRHGEMDPQYVASPRFRTRGQLLAARKKAMLPSAAYDLDKDGQIDQREMYLAARMDKNKDGKLSEEEMKQWKEKDEAWVNENIKFGLEAAGASRPYGTRIFQKEGAVIGDEVQEDFNPLWKKSRSHDSNENYNPNVADRLAENKRRGSRGSSRASAVPKLDTSRLCTPRDRTPNTARSLVSTPHERLFGRRSGSVTSRG